MMGEEAASEARQAPDGGFRRRLTLRCDVGYLDCRSFEVIASEKERGTEHQRSTDPADKPEGLRSDPRRSDRRE